MKKVVTVLLLIALLINVYCIYKFNFNNSIYVITESNNGSKNYYRLNDRKMTIKTESFIPDYMITYKLENCYINSDNNKNTVSFDTCRIYIDGEDTNLTSTFKHIITDLSKKSINNEIKTTKIFKINSDYYVLALFDEKNKNLYRLFKYNFKNDKIKLLYEFINEEVVGLRLNKYY